MKSRPTSTILLLVQVHEYENCSIEISFFSRNYVENNVLEVQNIDTKEKYIDPFTKVLVSNKSHLFYHVSIMNR